ncbi:MAG: hypothetical protein JJ863_23540 [Deltaproteobacteria bacterium]|nr:hypothetical protein [Deltaproteobacteria bacterium]
MRRLALVFLLALLTIPAAAQPAPQPSGSCSFTATWQERSGFVTTIDDQRQWQTFSNAGALQAENAPAAKGWVVHTEQGITFDWEGAEQGYEYAWRFSESCRVLDLDLVRVGGEPTQMQVQLHFTKLD